MLQAPNIFAIAVLGIAKRGNSHDVGRIGTVALIYFKVVSTLALVIGLIVVNLMQPGVGMSINTSTIDASSTPSYRATAA